MTIHFGEWVRLTTLSLDTLCGPRVAESGLQWACWLVPLLQGCGQDGRRYRESCRWYTDTGRWKSEGQVRTKSVGKTKSLFVVVYVLDPERKGIQYLLVGGGELTIFVVFIGSPGNNLMGWRLVLCWYYLKFVLWPLKILWEEFVELWLLYLVGENFPLPTVWVIK